MTDELANETIKNMPPVVAASDVLKNPVDLANETVQKFAKESGQRMPTKEERAAALNAFKEMWLKKHNISGIDLEKEVQLIQKKESTLSRSQRDAVMQYFMIFPAHVEDENINLGAPVTSTSDLEGATKIGE